MSGLLLVATSVRSEVTVRGSTAVRHSNPMDSERDLFVGLDGCKAGWFAIALHGWEEWETHTFSNMKGAWSALFEADLMLIDIPIGLRDEGAEGRRCDVAARRLLGRPRASSVFTPPARPALEFQRREDASQRNYVLTGRGIGVQSWGIAPKIREVDRLLREEPSARRTIREAHPELLFWALNGRTSMMAKKLHREGFEERVQVLSKVFPNSQRVIESARAAVRTREVARDDIVDALVLAVTGLLARGKLRTIPEVPEKDLFGLPMEMVYYLL